jgi:predicted RNA binding protein YcfA (HicA-like mRNA interferase family)
MSKLPLLTGKELISILKALGFIEKRVKGSHVFLAHENGRSTVVPVHSGETIGRGLLLKIIDDVGMTKDEFIKLIQ